MFTINGFKFPILFLLILHSFITAFTALKLNVPSVLLNYIQDLPTNYSLAISESDDCFLWYTADETLVTVTPIFDSPDCSRKATVSSVGTKDVLKTTRITAVHKSNPSIKVSSDVFTDVPKSIQLYTSSDEVFIGGPWRKISVKAKNNMDRVFDSINGIQFNWSISCDQENAIRLRRVSESNYTKDENDPWQIRGLLSSSTIYAKAMSEGSCTITAATMDFRKRKLPYHMLSTPPIKLVAVPNVESHPASDIYIILNSKTRIQLKTKEGNKIEVDPANFHVENLDPGVASLSSDLKTVTGKKLGTTTLIYKTHSDFSEYEVRIHVTEPKSIELQISRGGFTILEEMKSYRISVIIRDDTDKMIDSDNLKVKIKFPNKLFHLNQSSENGMYHVVQTLAPGSGIIKADFGGIILEDGSVLKSPQSLTTSVKVKVCHKLQLFPPHLLLPNLKNQIHEVTLKVSGGTNAYSWGTDSSAVTINFDEMNGNLIKAKVGEVGSFNIFATDKNNVNFIATSKISVSDIVDIEVYPTVVEAEIGNMLLLPVAFLGYESKEQKSTRKFDDCSSVEPTIEIIEKHVLTFADNENYIPAFGRGCKTLQFKCKAPGHSRVNVFYNSSKVLKTTTVLSCFKSLRAVHPVRVAVLASGSSKDIAFEGGPRKNPLFKEGHKTNLKPSNPSLVDIQLIKDPIRYNRDLTVFNVHCKSIGETVLLFQIGNEASATMPHPAMSETSIKLVCGEPYSVHLKVHKTSERSKKEESNIVKVPFYGEKLFSVDIWLKDSVGRKFSNISAFEIAWVVSDSSLAAPTDTYNGVTTHENAVSGFRKISRDFKEFKMTGSTGKLSITAKITGYRQNILSNLNTNYAEFKEISKTLDLKLISLRDLNAGSYSEEDKQGEENFCDGDSCKA